MALKIGSLFVCYSAQEFRPFKVSAQLIADKALSEEVERLQKLLQEGISTCSKDGKNDNMQLNSPEGAPTTSRSQSSGKSKGMRRKRSREFEAGSEVVVTPGCSGQDKDTAGEAAKDISKETVSNGTLAYDQLVCL